MKVTCADWSETKQQRELQAILQLCHDCEHLVRVFEILRERDCRLYFVCEFMADGDLKDFLAKYQRQGKPVEQEVVRSIVHQILLGLHHIHSKGFMHRDLKPENLLLSGGKCKVADFSLARPLTCTKPDMTVYVSSRWYRAPELVLEATMYTTAIDMFALGCVMAEILLLYPLFPGRDEHDQLPLIFSLLGPFKDHDWPEGTRLLKKLQVKVPETVQPEYAGLSISQRLAKKLRLDDPSTIELLDGLLKLNPRHRLKVTSALQHEYFYHRECKFPMSEGPRPEPSPISVPGHFELNSHGCSPIMQTPMTRNADTINSYTISNDRVPLVSISPSTREMSAIPALGQHPQVWHRCASHQLYDPDAYRNQYAITHSSVPDFAYSPDTYPLGSMDRPSHAFGIE